MRNEVGGFSTHGRNRARTWFAESEDGVRVLVSGLESESGRGEIGHGSVRRRGSRAALRRDPGY
jgi:hypothetical protein